MAENQLVLVLYKSSERGDSFVIFKMRDLDNILFDSMAQNIHFDQCVESLGPIFMRINSNDIANLNHKGPKNMLQNKFVYINFNEPDDNDKIMTK